MTAEQSAAVDRLADAATEALAAWHTARQAQTDAAHAYEAAIVAAVIAGQRYRAASAEYEAQKRWR